MKPTRRILVAVKNTRRTRSPAIRKAASLARALNASLELFHSLCEPLAIEVLAAADTSLRSFEKSEQSRHLKRLEAAAVQLRREGIDVSTAVEWDYPAHEALVRRALRTGADLIVAERHADPHVAPWLLRYTDWELLRQSPVPFLLVKTARPYDSPTLLAAVDPSHAFAKTAKLDDEILRLAARISTATGGELHAFHAYVPTIAGMKPAELSAPDATARIIDRAESLARKRLDSSLRAARTGNIPDSQRHLVARHPVDAIPELARRLRCDIVVMGALSRSGLKRLVIGNTAERLLDDLPCDLLIVKPPDFVTHVPAKIRGPQLIALMPGASLM